MFNHHSICWNQILFFLNYGNISTIWRPQVSFCVKSLVIAQMSPVESLHTRSPDTGSFFLFLTSACILTTPALLQVTIGIQFHFLALDCHEVIMMKLSSDMITFSLSMADNFIILLQKRKHSVLFSSFITVFIQFHP